MSKKFLKLEAALNTSLKVNQKLELGDDTFLTGDLSGGDKIYGFIRSEDGVLVDCGSSEYYDLEEMDKESFNYIFTSGIYNSILSDKFKKVKA